MADTVKASGALTVVLDGLQVAAVGTNPRPTIHGDAAISFAGLSMLAGGVVVPFKVSDARTFNIEPENRVCTIMAEGRTVAIDPENREYRVA